MQHGCAKYMFTKNFRQGNAMLELVLLLPTYVLLIYIVMTMGEYGQVATSMYNAARVTAWKSTKGSSYPYSKSTKSKVQTVFFDHFGPRIKVLSGNWSPTPLSYDGTKSSSVTMGKNGVAVLEGANDFAFGTNPNALPISATNYAAQIEADQPKPSLYNTCEQAMNGDDTAGTKTDETVSWLRRQYSSVRVKYTPIGEIVSPPTFRIFHTVLRFQTWNTQEHKPYSGMGSNPATLRDVEAYMTASGTIARPGAENHQMDKIASDHLKPNRP